MKVFMKIGLAFIVSCLLTGFDVNAQNKIDSYQYWFDNDYSTNSHEMITPAEQLQLNTAISIETLTNGLHTFSIRFRDEKGLWSIPTSQLFFYTDLIDNKIDGYQYWFDNDFNTNSHTTVSLTEQLQLDIAISLETLTNGLHSFSIRFKDTKGKWSIPSSQFFYYTDLIENKIESYQYWFDNDFNTNINNSVALKEQMQLNTLLPIEMISTGLHLFTIRFKDTKGKWSIPISRYFYKTNKIAHNKITAYRYWIDDDIANAKYFVLSSPTRLFIMNEDLDLSGLSNGEYTIHLQFKDSSDKWSLVTSDIFTLNKLTSIENTFEKEITTYPNPTTGIFNIDFGSNFKDIEVQLYNNLGKRIKQQFYKNEQNVKIDLNNYSTGIFFVKVLADDKKAEFQFIKL